MTVALGAAPGWGVWFEPLLPARQLARLAQIAEEAGASHVFVADEGTDRDAWVVLTAIALATTRIRIATGITNPFSRHAVATAAAFATLEELAPGRVIAGFGVGGSRVLGPIGLAPSRPYTALRETIDAVGRLLGGEEVSADGEVRIERARIAWSPGRLPVAIAGRGPRVEALAIETADWLLLAGKPLAQLPGLFDRVRSGRPDPSRSPARIAWSPYLGWTPGMVDEIRPHFTYATVDMPPATRNQLGVDEATASRILEVMRRDGTAAAAPLVPDSVIEGCAVVGDPAAVIRRLADLRESARPDLFVLAMNDYARAEQLITDAAPLIAAAGYGPDNVEES
jgi:5,10-methylenetetrahydromethanopterin reductase